MLELKSEKKGYSINLPVELNEFTPELLNAITDGVNLPKHYCIVAMCYNVKLMDIAINVNNDKEQQVSVTPILAKISDEDAERMNIKVSNRIIIDRSSLERGIHLVIPIMASSKNVSAFIKGDEVLRKRLLQAGDGSKDILHLDKTPSKRELDEAAPKVYVVEFKVVPVNDIVANVAIDHKIIDPFKLKPLTLVN